MKPQRLALCVIGGMVTVAGGIVIVVLVRDGHRSGSSLEGKQLAVDGSAGQEGSIAAGPEPTGRPEPKAPSDATEPNIQEDTSPPPSNSEPAPLVPPQPDLGYTLADVEAYFLRGEGWKWTEVSEQGDGYRSVATNGSFPNVDFDFVTAGLDRTSSLYSIVATVAAAGGTPDEQLAERLVVAGAVLAELSDWEFDDLVDWINLAMTGMIAEGRVADDVNGLCKGTQQISMRARTEGGDINLAIGVEAVTPERAAKYPQWQPSAPTETNADLSVEVETKTVERTDVWHRVSYIVTITNNTAATLEGSATIEFLDAQGFVLDEQWVSAPSIAPGENTFRGFKLILLPLATKVASTEVKVTAL